jgi:hypothetical protein
MSKLLTILQQALKNKQHIHRVPSDTKRGRQIRSQSSTQVKMPNRGQGTDEQSTNRGRERAKRKRDI